MNIIIRFSLQELREPDISILGTGKFLEKRLRNRRPDPIDREIPSPRGITDF